MTVCSTTTCLPLEIKGIRQSMVRQCRSNGTMRFAAVLAICNLTASQVPPLIRLEIPFTRDSFPIDGSCVGTSDDLPILNLTTTCQFCVLIISERANYTLPDLNNATNVTMYSQRVVFLLEYSYAWDGASLSCSVTSLSGNYAKQKNISVPAPLFSSAIPATAIAGWMFNITCSTRNARITRIDIIDSHYRSVMWCDCFNVYGIGAFSPGYLITDISNKSCTASCSGKASNVSFFITATANPKQDGEYMCSFLYMNGSYVSKYTDRPSALLITVPEPPIITPETTAAFFEDQMSQISCRTADESATDVLTWSVRRTLNATANVNSSCAAAGACNYASHFGTDGFGVPASTFTFTAKRDEWNGATVTCTSRTSGLSASVTVSTHSLPPINVSTDTISTYVGMTATATCFARKLWTVAELAWSVRHCGGSQCVIASDVPLPCGVRQTSFVASLDWNGAKLACSATTPYRQQSSEISVIVKPFPKLKLSPDGPNLTIGNVENVTIFCAASEHFTGGALLWSTRCSAGPCPLSQQGSLDAAAGGRRYLAFKATGAWNGATVLCFVARYPDSACSLSINFIGATQSSFETMLDADGSNFFLSIGLCVAAAVALSLCAVGMAMLFRKRPKSRRSPNKSRAKSVPNVGTSFGSTKPSALKKRGIPDIATAAAVPVVVTQLYADQNSESTPSGLISLAPVSSTGSRAGLAPRKRTLKSSRGAPSPRMPDLKKTRVKELSRTHGYDDHIVLSAFTVIPRTVGVTSGTVTSRALRREPLFTH